MLSVAGDFVAHDARTKPGYKWEAAVVSAVQIPAGSRTIRAFFQGQPGADTAGASAPIATLPSHGCIP